LGTSSARARKLMEELYLPFVRQGNPIIFMDERSAELTKYAANSFLATKISFMNEIANLCELLGADVDLVRIGIGSDQRIGKRFLFPGIGYGGSCFPKDVKALVKSAADAGYKFDILESVMEVNERQKTILMPRINKYFNNQLEGKKIAVWGLSFKPDTDDIREAPALYMINDLIEAGAVVSAYDPEAMQNVKKVYGRKITFAANQYDALEGADALLICTEWPAFRNPDFDQMIGKLARKVIFDGRNLYTTDQMKKAGFTYFSIGRKSVKKSK
jgi:UDPglucose 6-dehydrogenase